MTKKIFIASDIHDDVEAFAAFSDYAIAQEPDEIWLAGDFSLRPYRPEDLAEFIEGKDKERFITAKRAHNREVIDEMAQILRATGITHKVIPGNYDPEISDIFSNRDINWRAEMIGGARIVGYGGASHVPEHIGVLAQLDEIVKYDEREFYELLGKEKPNIVLSHTPPRGMCDVMFNGANVGSDALRAHIDKYAPKLVVAGHVHESGPLGRNPRKVYGFAKHSNGTIVLNPGNLGRFEVVNFPSLETDMKFPYGTFGEVVIEDDGTPVSAAFYSITGKDGTDGIQEVKDLDRYS